MLHSSAVPSPYRIVFVLHHGDRWPEVLAGETPAPDAVPERIKSNEDCWILQTYLRLRRAGFPVEISTRPDPGAVNVVDGVDFGTRRLRPDAFFLACRSDGTGAEVCQVIVVQNPRDSTGAHCAYLPHWPQPGLRPRDPSRGVRVERVVFKGDENVNLLPALRGEGFRAKLAALGCTWEVSGKSPRGEPVAWNDYREADVVVAVRDISAAFADAKPSSKLVNAWLAGVPAALGPESAYHDLRRTPYDYLEVRSEVEVLEAVAWLQRHPAAYAEMVRNGLARGREFAADALVERWWAFLGGPAVGEAFVRFQRLGALGKRLDTARRVLRHRVLKARRVRGWRTAPSVLAGPRSLVLPA